MVTRNGVRAPAIAFVDVTGTRPRQIIDEETGDVITIHTRYSFAIARDNGVEAVLLVSGNDLTAALSTPGVVDLFGVDRTILTATNENRLLRQHNVREATRVGVNRGAAR